MSLAGGIPRRKFVRATHRISVMQLNALAHNYSGESRDEFAKRMQLHSSHIVQLRPTVAVIEEVDNPREFPELFLPDLVKVAARGVAKYDYVCGAKDNGIADRTCVMFDTDEVKLVSVEEIRLEGSQFALCCIFEHIAEVANQRLQLASSNEFLVVAQHCKAGRTDDNEMIRISHTATVFSALTENPRFADLLKRMIWVGDFNAGPHSYDGKYPDLWHRVVIDRSAGPVALPSGALWENTDPRTQFVSSVRQLAGEEYEFTTVKWRDGRLIAQTIDYIFLPVHGNIRCTGVLQQPRFEELPPSALPCDWWGSDHLSLFAELEFTSGEITARM